MLTVLLLKGRKKQEFELSLQLAIVIYVTRNPIKQGLQ